MSIFRKPSLAPGDPPGEGRSSGACEGMQAMLREIAAECTEVCDGLRRGPIGRRVLEAMGRVPRHEFVPAEDIRVAYLNRPLPIGHGQTISQPFIVAFMTELLGLKAEDKVLEIGTGSGYQTAILAELAREVFSVEVIAALAEQARTRLQALGYDNVSVRVGDGHEGWPEHAPYDGIVVTAATPEVPSALLEQLNPGARLVIPIGFPHDVQWLTEIEKLADGRPIERRVLAVRFVPLTGG